MSPLIYLQKWHTVRTKLCHVENEFFFVYEAVVVFVQDLEGVPQVFVHFVRNLVQNAARQHEILKLTELHRAITCKHKRQMWAVT